jgi:hypothetical protein
MWNIGASFKTCDCKQHDDRDQNADQAQDEKIRDQRCRLMALSRYLLRNVSSEAGVGCNFEKCAHGDYVTPEAVGFDTEAAHDDGEGHECDGKS